MRLYDQRIRYTIRGPWMRGRKSFELWKDVVNEDGRRIQTKVVDARIAALNQSHKHCLVNLSQARSYLFNLKREYEKQIAVARRDVPPATENVDIVSRFIKERIDIKTACTPGSRMAEKNYATRAIGLLGEHPLRTVPVKVIQNILDCQKSRGGNKHLVRTYRSLLEYVGRVDEAKKLKRKRFPQYKPPYLERDQVYEIANVPDAWLEKFPLMPDLIKLGFNLGTRISELLALEKGAVRRAEGQIVFSIHQQWVRADHVDESHPRLRDTKNKNKRLVVPIDLDETLECLERLLTTHPRIEDREHYREGLGRYIRGACREKFGIELADVQGSGGGFFDLENLPGAEDDREYRSIHMLRAAHAVYMMAKTGNESFVAYQLGDTPEVVRMHYAGRTNKAATIAEVAKILGRC